MGEVDNSKRSYNMSKIKGKDTKPELIVRKILYKNGYRYRLHSTKVVGKPDIIFEKKKNNFCSWLFLAQTRKL